MAIEALSAYQLQLVRALMDRSRKGQPLHPEWTLKTGRRLLATLDARNTRIRELEAEVERLRQERHLTACELDGLEGYDTDDGVYEAVAIMRDDLARVTEERNDLRGDLATAVGLLKPHRRQFTPAGRDFLDRAIKRLEADDE